MQKNKFVQKATWYATVLGSAAIIGLVAGHVKHRVSTGMTNRQKSLLQDKIQPEILEIIVKDETYFSIVGRIADYQPISSQAFEDLVRAIVPVIEFLESRRSSNQKITMQDNKDYVFLGHAVIEATRIFRTILEMKMPNVLEDFDEIATDIQAKYDEDREAMLFDAQLRW